MLFCKGFEDVERKEKICKRQWNVSGVPFFVLENPEKINSRPVGFSGINLSDLGSPHGFNSGGCISKKWAFNVLAKKSLLLRQSKIQFTFHDSITRAHHFQVCYTWVETPGKQTRSERVNLNSKILRLINFSPTTCTSLGNV